MSIQDNLNKTRARIDSACKQAGRNPAEVQLLLATKTQSVATINEAIALGYGLIGENRAQEVIMKAPYLLDTPTALSPRENHFIGHLQSNKINGIIHAIDCFQSIDRFSIAKRLNDACLRDNLIRSVFIQVNTSYEATKSGVSSQELFALLEKIASFSQLTIRGFMTLGLNEPDEQKVRQGFSELKKLNEQAIKQGLIPDTATELSMGMSHDLEWAILEGSTLIRVGSAVFGQRQ